MARRQAPVLVLVLLSPLIAEFLLGNVYITGIPRFGQQAGQLAVFVAFYGSAALLIREVARRLDRGWPTILTLALAFGLLEEGLVTQSLFNPDYLGIRVLDAGFVPVLGIGMPWTIYLLAVHTVWSISTPIALTEALFGREPWLGRVGCVAWSVVFVLGCVAQFLISLVANPTFFIAEPFQLVGAGVIVVGLVVLAVRGFRAPPSNTLRGNPWAGLAVGLLAGSALQGLERWERVSPWLLGALMLVLLAVTAVTVRALRAPAMAVAAGTLLTYCWVGMYTAISIGWPAIIEQAVLVIAAVALLVLIVRRSPNWHADESDARSPAVGG